VELDGLKVSLASRIDQEIQGITGKAPYRAGAIDADLRITQENGVTTMGGRGTLDRAERKVSIQALVVSRGRAPWRLDEGAVPVVGWDNRGVTIAGLAMSDAATGTQHLAADGSWFPQGGGTLDV